MRRRSWTFGSLQLEKYRSADDSENCSGLACSRATKCTIYFQFWHFTQEVALPYTLEGVVYTVLVYTVYTQYMAKKYTLSCNPTHVHINENDQRAS